MPNITEKDLKEYANRLANALDALGVTLVVTVDEDTLRVVSTHEDAKELRRAETRLDYMAAFIEIQEEVDSIINKGDDDE